MHPIYFTELRNKTIRLFLLFTLIFGSFFQSWAQPIIGKVYDIKTGDPLPGVAISYNQTSRLGVISDDNGNFTIPQAGQVEVVIFYFIGYKTLKYTKAELPKNLNRWNVMLEPEVAMLNEIKIVAGENPALRIVRHAISNRQANNPRFYPSYKYVSYNKNVVTYQMELPDSATEKDRQQFMRDTANSQNRHLLIIESVTRKLYLYPNKNKEEIIGTKISGFQQPGVGTVPSGIQNFAMHENIIPLVNKKFLNPIADGADKHYAYILSDTLYDGTDTIFEMDYFPERGANFEGFKGKLRIHTRKWALVYITAKPADEGKINLNFSQDYVWVQGNFWFPKHLNFELELERIPFRELGAVMIGKTTLDSIEINLPLREEMFNHIEVAIKEDAGRVNDNFWETYRNENLSVKEQETYRQMDSIGDRYMFDALLKGTRNLYEGFIAVGVLDIEMNKLFAYNAYEGLRLGMGLYTNQDISKKFRVGGYVGHGDKDNAWKYGGSFRWYFNKPNDFYATISYLNDVRDPGGIRLKYSEWGTLAQQFFNVLMDKVQEAEVSLTFRAAEYTVLKIGMRHFELQPTYTYQFTNGTADPSTQPFRFTEAQLTYRWQYKEKFSNTYGQRISHSSKNPIVYGIYSRGMQDVLDGNFEYNKVELGMLYSHYIKNLGRLRFSVEGGFVDRPVPWSMNFSGRPSYNPSFSVVVRETFQTMRFNEFSSSSYAAFFLLHDFGPLLLRYKAFKPEIRLAQGIMYGKLTHPEMHVGVPFKTLEHGYFESGLILDNLLRINIFNAGYFGIGAGAFYRYGAYSLPNDRDNWAFKISFMYSVN